MTDDNNLKETEQPKEGFQLLLDSKYPLLQEFREKCPGTFKHSQSLVAMIEGVSLELGLDVDFMKTSAYYHDVGKMFNPKYFTENQLESEDFHKGLQVKMSYEIITRHVSDSVIILLNDSNFPREIIEIISQHHGTTVLRYFFNKSKKADDTDFRYKTSIPNSVESAVLMITDSVEATSRSLAQAGKLESTDVIDNTINRLLDSGQLDEVTIKLGDLKKIKTALGKELEGVYQKRIEYPDEISNNK
jgi:putative nucleotidyltransferase with HDIG domain